MNKKICFAIAAVMTVLYAIGLSVIDSDEVIQLVTELIVAIPLCIGIFTYTQHCIDNAPEKSHKIAAYFRITTGVSSITYGLPALIYIIYTLIKRDDGYVMRGIEYEGDRGTVITVLAGISALNMMFDFTVLISSIVSLAILIVPFVAAVKTENARLQNLSK